MTEHVRTGLEIACEDGSLLRGRTVGLLANQASVTAELQPAWAAVAGAGARLVRLFAPEHGLWGVAEDMEAVASETESVSGLAVRSLYGSSARTLAPRAEDLDGLDAVVVDLQDVGSRYYTFAATMAHTMEACESAGVEVIVCDRPNPLGGTAVEGGPVETGYRSFVSEVPVPVRHGLTIGEIALLLQVRRYADLQLSVVPCRGWRREQWWDATGLPWVAPSPNMPTLLTASIYPGACLVEATNLSEGRGTTRPFQLVGAPWLDGTRLAERLNALGLPGCAFRAVRFRPAFQKHAGTVCEGVEWHVLDRAAMRPYETGVHLLAEARRLDPESFSWRREPYEFVAETPALDLLTGSARVRECIEKDEPVADLASEWAATRRDVLRRRAEFLLYPDDEGGS